MEEFLARVLSQKAFWSVLSAVAKAEFLTPLGWLNLFLAIAIVWFAFSLKGDTFSTSTLNWARDAAVGGWVLMPLVVCIVLAILMVLASMFLLYLQGVHKREQG